MISDALNASAELGIFPAIGLVLFIVCFIAVIVWVMTLDKQLVDEMSQLPLEGDRPSDAKGERL